MARKKARVTTDQVDAAATPSEIVNILNLEDVERLPVSMIPIDRIDPNPFQPRRYFDAESITELATALQANGFLGSLVARDVEGRYQLAFGERRLRAAKEANIDRIPLHISDFSDEQMAEVAITENVNREDLTPVEEARGYQVLYEQFNYSYRNIAERVGKSFMHIQRMLSLLKYENVREAVEQGRITASAAAELVKVEDNQKRNQLLDEVAAKGLGRDALRAAVKVANESEPDPIPPESQDDSSQPQPLVSDIYDPIPKLYAALNNIKRVQRHRLDKMIDNRRGDAAKLIEEMEFLLKEIKDDL